MAGGDGGGGRLVVADDIGSSSDIIGHCHHHRRRRCSTLSFDLLHDTRSSWNVILSNRLLLLPQLPLLLLLQQQLHLLLFIVVHPLVHVDVVKAKFGNVKVVLEIRQRAD